MSARSERILAKMLGKDKLIEKPSEKQLEVKQEEKPIEKQAEIKQEEQPKPKQPPKPTKPKLTIAEKQKKREAKILNVNPNSDGLLKPLNVILGIAAHKAHMIGYLVPHAYRLVHGNDPPWIETMIETKPGRLVKMKVRGYRIEDLPLIKEAIKHKKCK